MKKRIGYGLVLASIMSLAGVVGWAGVVALEPERAASAQKSTSPPVLSLVSSNPDQPEDSIVAVQGVVALTQPRWVESSKWIETEVTLQVERATQPDIGGVLTFTVPGGELIERNIRMVINGVPILRTGERIAVSLDALNEPGGTDYRYRTHLPLAGDLI